MTDEDRIRMLLMAVQETPMGMAAMPLSEEDYQRFQPAPFGRGAPDFTRGPQAPKAYYRKQYPQPPEPRKPVGIDGESMAKGRPYTGIPLN